MKRQLVTCPDCGKGRLLDEHNITKSKTGGRCHPCGSAWLAWREQGSFLDKYPELAVAVLPHSPLQPHEVKARGKVAELLICCVTCGDEVLVSAQALARQRAGEVKCGYCVRHANRVAKGSFADARPDLVELVLPESPVQPDDVGSGSSKNFLVKCRECSDVRTVRVRSFAQSLTGGLCKACGLEGRGYVSKKELQVLAFVEGLGVRVIGSDRKALPGRLEIDVYCPDLKLAIEFNGEYYHRDEEIRAKRGMSGAEWHSLKSTLAARQGLTMAHVWEKDWDEDREAVEEALRRFVESRGSDLDPRFRRVTSTWVRAVA